MQNEISPKTRAEIEKLAARMAKKAGYGDLSEEDDIFGGAKSGASFSRFKKKRLSAAERFSMEMKDFLLDRLKSLMDKGFSEAQALAATQEKFGNSALPENLNSFAKEKEYKENRRLKNMNKYDKYNQPSVGRSDVVMMFYAAFIIIGAGTGAIIGKLTEMLTFGIVSGLVIGLGLGIASHGIVLLDKMDKER